MNESFKHFVSDENIFEGIKDENESRQPSKIVITKTKGDDGSEGYIVKEFDDHDGKGWTHKRNMPLTDEATARQVAENWAGGKGNIAAYKAAGSPVRDTGAGQLTLGNAAKRGSGWGAWTMADSQYANELSAGNEDRQSIYRSLGAPEEKKHTTGPTGHLRSFSSFRNQSSETAQQTATPQPQPNESKGQRLQRLNREYSGTRFVAVGPEGDKHIIPLSYIKREVD